MAEILSTDLLSWEIGPFHGALPGPMRLKLALDGEIIVGGEVETGFLHRGVEKAIELHPWHAAPLYAGHVDPEGAPFGELAVCLAVEEIAGIEVSARARAIRGIVVELSRISSHLAFCARMARAVDADTFSQYALRDRERILDLFELLSGSRHAFNLFRYGGVASDVTEGFLERLEGTCSLLLRRLEEYDELLTRHQIFLGRTRGVGALTRRQAERLGVTGPNARADGDAHDRFLLRLGEISDGIGILRATMGAVPSGPFLGERTGYDRAIPAGEAYSRVESSRGLLGCHVVSDGGRYPVRVQFRTPSLFHLLAIPEILVGARVEDLPVILASLDLSIGEADR